MSADNGIYILKYLDENMKLKFRVEHAQAIDNINYEPDYPKEKPVLNLRYTLWYFLNSPEFDNEKDTLEFACKLYEKWEYTEYGVCELDYSNIYIPFEKHNFNRDEKDMETYLNEIFGNEY